MVRPENATPETKRSARAPNGRSRALRFGGALLMAAWSVAMTYLLRAQITPVIFVFFYPTVVAAAWLGGFWPGAFVAVVGAFTADLLFMGEPGRLSAPDAEEMLLLAIFLSLSALVSLLMRRIRAGQAELERREAEARALVAQLQLQAADLEAQALDLEQTMEQAQAARAEAEAARLHSERERRRVALLAETSRALSEAREYYARLETLAEVVVRELAEICVVDVLDEDGAVRRVAVAGRDAGLEDGLARVRSLAPRLGEPLGAGRVLATGEPDIRLELTPGMLEQPGVTAAYREFLAAAQPRSLIVMPMKSADRLLGAVSFIRTEQSPRFEEADVELTRVLAIRAGVLIEMARLYSNALQEIERRRVVERELQQKAALLEELNVEQEETMAALEDQTQQAQEAERAAIEASAAKSQFLAVMSHELRTPLNAIMGYTDLLQSGASGVELNDAGSGFLDRIRASVLHLRGLIDEVLSLSRIEAGKENVEAARVNLTALVREVGAMMQPDAVQKGLRLQLHLEGDVIAVTDPGKLRQILINLASNAIKFTDAGSVTVALRLREERVELEVADTGIGIAAADRGRIFEPFTQVDQSRTRRAGGTGLGLAVSLRLARLLGGDLELESEPGRGSRFRVTLPAEIPVSTGQR